MKKVLVHPNGNTMRRNQTTQGFLVGDAWLSLDDMTRYFPGGWEEHSLALDPVLEPADLSSDDDATSSSSDDDLGTSKSIVPNHFEMFLAAIGHVQPPRLLALYNTRKMKHMERMYQTPGIKRPPRNEQTFSPSPIKNFVLSNNRNSPIFSGEKFSPPDC